MFLKFVKVIAPFLVGFIFIIGSSVNANDVSVKYNATSDSIELEWKEELSSFVEIYKGTEKLGLVEENSFLVESLEPNTLYNLTLAYLDEDKSIIDFDYLKLSTQPQMDFRSFSIQEPEQKLEDIVMNSMYVEDEVIITWDKGIPNIDEEYAIYRNGEEIGKTSERFFTDNTVETGESYTYEISTKDLVPEEVLNERIEGAKAYNIKVTPEVKKELSYDYYSVNSFIEIPEKSLSLHLENIEAMSIINRWGLQYTTFIPDELVTDLGNWLPGYNYYIGGDNRGFDIFNNDYRTRSAIMVDFTNNRIQADTTRPGIPTSGIDVSPTRQYEKDGTPIDPITQSNYDWNFTSYGFTSSGNAAWEAGHSVGIPVTLYNIVTPPAIDYWYHADMNSSSTSNVSGFITGNHDRAPSHEIVLYIPESGFGEIIYRHTNEGFQHLFPAPISPDKNISIRF